MKEITDNSYEIAELVPYSDYNKDVFDLKPGEVLVFPWEIPTGSSTSFDIVQTANNAQDHTIKAWLSHKPLDEVMFSRVDYLNWYDVKRISAPITVYDQTGIEHDHTKLKAKPNKTYFLNVKNTAGTDNQFSVKFSYIPENNAQKPSSPTNVKDVNHSLVIGTSTPYGNVVAQLDHGLTITQSGGTYNLMRNDKIIASVKLAKSSITGLNDVVSTYQDGSDYDTAYIPMLVSWLAKNKPTLDVTLEEAIKNKAFWEIVLYDKPNDYNLVLWSKENGTQPLSKPMMDCKELWGSSPENRLIIT